MGQYGEIIIYQTQDGLTKINVNMQEETVWLSLDQMAELFQRDKSTISRHIRNVFVEGELIREQKNHSSAFIISFLIFECKLHFHMQIPFCSYKKYASQMIYVKK